MERPKDQRGREIVADLRLKGSKFAVRRGGQLIVSPAMMRLIRDCQNADDLYHLLDQIPVRIVSAASPLPTPGR